MKLSQFNFNLPESLVAQKPAPNRDESRLLVLDRQTGKIEHKIFKDVLSYFDDKDTLVFNNTKVFPSRMYGKKERTDDVIEVFMLRELNKELRLWDVLVDPARKIRVGNKLYFGENDLLVAEVVDNTTSRGRTIRFLFEGTDEEFRANVEYLGETPLPKYITRRPDEEDKERFQTIFAKHEGAISAPAAGMHFSRELMKRLELKGVEFSEVTLHVGLGTFRTVEVEDITKHRMDSEHFIIEPKQADIINKAITAKKRICAVGVTSLRAVESSVSTEGFVKPANDWTSKFFYSASDFSIANSMITNFHSPQSILLIQVSAFGGHEFVMNAYEEAVKEKYKFHTYGDAMLII